MKEPDPVIVAELFPEVLDALLGLLSSLPESDWDHPTACSSWSVKDVALHLLGDEVGNLSRRRDGFAVEGPAAGWDELVAFINEWNAQWVQAGQKMSPRLICDLLSYVGSQVCEYFSSLDPYAMGGAVSWAGPNPAPVWLDVAREYTERWLHQQHIRDATDRPGLTGPHFLAPVIDTFVRALPRTYEDDDAPDGTLVSLVVVGPSGGRWSLLRENERWRLYLDIARDPDAEAAIPEDIAWRLFTKGLDPREARAHATLSGRTGLALRILETVSIIA